MHSILIMIRIIITKKITSRMQCKKMNMHINYNQSTTHLPIDIIKCEDDQWESNHPDVTRLRNHNTCIFNNVNVCVCVMKRWRCSHWWFDIFINITSCTMIRVRQQQKHSKKHNMILHTAANAQYNYRMLHAFECGSIVLLCKRAQCAALRTRTHNTVPFQHRTNSARFNDILQIQFSTSAIAWTGRLSYESLIRR